MLEHSGQACVLGVLWIKTPVGLRRMPRTQVVVEGTQFVQVVCGGMHTVALSSQGEVWSWGVNDEGALGRITTGTCWEDEAEDAKANPAEPGKAVTPEGVRFVEVRTDGALCTGSGHLCIHM